MEYTERDVLEAIAIALEWGASGIAMAAQDVRDGHADVLSAGAGAIVEATPAAVELLARAQDAIDGTGSPEPRTSGRGISRYDYRGM